MKKKFIRNLNFDTIEISVVHDVAKYEIKLWICKSLFQIVEYDSN